MKLNLPMIKIWIEVLRSGKYKQTTGALRKARINNQFEYCCLGVLCDITRPILGNHWFYDKVSQRNFIHDKVFNLKQKFWLPQNVVMYMGFDDHNPWFLAVLNDKEVPFTAIAKQIFSIVVKEDQGWWQNKV